MEAKELVNRIGIQLFLDGYVTLRNTIFIADWVESDYPESAKSKTSVIKVLKSSWREQVLEGVLVEFGLESENCMVMLRGDEDLRYIRFTDINDIILLSGLVQSAKNGISALDSAYKDFGALDLKISCSTSEDGITECVMRQGALNVMLYELGGTFFSKQPNHRKAQDFLRYFKVINRDITAFDIEGVKYSKAALWYVALAKVLGSGNSITVEAHMFGLPKMHVTLLDKCDITLNAKFELCSGYNADIEINSKSNNYFANAVIYAIAKLGDTAKSASAEFAASALVDISRVSAHKNAQSVEYNCLPAKQITHSDDSITRIIVFNEIKGALLLHFSQDTKVWMLSSPDRKYCMCSGSAAVDKLKSILEELNDDNSADKKDALLSTLKACVATKVPDIDSSLTLSLETAIEAVTFGASASEQGLILNNMRKWLQERKENLR